MAHNPDDPTRRIPPTRPPGDRTYEEQVTEHEPALEELRDSVRSLRTALVLVGLLAAAALGVALWTLLDADEEDGRDRRGASPARVENLSDRVNELENRIDDRATKNSLSELERRQDELESQLEQVSEQASETSGPDEQTQQALEDLQSDLQALEQQVEQLSSEQGSGGAP